MEFLVKEKVYQEVQKLPANVAQFISLAGVCTYALNRLPAIYVASEEGKKYQLKKAEEMKEKIYSTVHQAIAAILRDPIRRATPINLNTVDTQSISLDLVLRLSELIDEKDDPKGKVPLDELSNKAIATIKAYQFSNSHYEK